MRRIGSPGSSSVARSTDALMDSVQSTMLLVLPALIARTGLLSFISRLHLTTGPGGLGFKEVPVSAAALRTIALRAAQRNAPLAP